MHHCRFIPKPSYPNSNIHIILPGTDYHYIIRLCKSKFLCEFRIETSLCFCCR